MACTVIEGILRGCETANVGGIVEAYIIDQTDVIESGLTVNLTAHTVTAIETTPGESFTTFQFRRNTGNINVELTTDLVNGSSVYVTTLTLVFHKREASKSRALQLLAEGQRYLAIIVKDANGKYWWLDFSQLNGGTEASGTAKTDGSNYTVTFLSEYDHRPYEVSASIIPALIA